MQGYDDDCRKTITIKYFISKMNREAKPEAKWRLFFYENAAFSCGMSWMASSEVENFRFAVVSVFSFLEMITNMSA